MGIKITKTSAGSVKLAYDSTYSEMYGNLTNVSIIPDLVNQAVKISWSGITKNISLSNIESINGSAPPTDIQVLATLLADTVFKFGGGDGSGVTLPIAIADVTNLQTTLDGKVLKDGTKVLSDVNFSTANSTKLASVASGATANSSDVSLRDRTTHTGAQAISTITSLQTILDSKVIKATANGALQIYAMDATGANAYYTFDKTGVTTSDSTISSSKATQDYVISRRKASMYTFTADGVATVYTFPHGLNAWPSFVGVTRGISTDFSAFATTWNDTTVTITYEVAPATGVNRLNWVALV